MNALRLVTLLNFVALAALAQNLNTGSLPEFKSITVRDKAFLVQMLDLGNRFSYVIGDAAADVMPKVSNYGETIPIPFGQEACFTAHHLTLILRPQTNGAACLIERRVDFRSLGQKLVVESFTMQTNGSGKIVFSAVARRETD